MYFPNRERSFKDLPLPTFLINAMLVGCLMMSASLAQALAITDPGDFTAAMTIIDYENSPVGVLAGGTSITDQYATLGVLHDGSTTTPPGPPGMSSASALPALESPFGDSDSELAITITFTEPVTQIGASYLMGSDLESIFLGLFRANDSLIESATIDPIDMLFTPGPFGFNEGFVGVIADEAVAYAIFEPIGGSGTAFVIDDLHFGNASAIPEPSAALLFGTGFGVAGIAARRRRVN